MNLHDKIKEMYIDYVNNFLSVQGFADHYHISKTLAAAIITEGQFLKSNDDRRDKNHTRQKRVEYLIDCLGYSEEEAHDLTDQEIKGIIDRNEVAEAWIGGESND